MTIGIRARLAAGGMILALAFLPSILFAEGEGLTLQLRRQVETAPESGQWHPLVEETQWDPQETAIVICDMWDKHWCAGATSRVAEMAPRMNEVVATAREQGVLIIHCPSNCVDNDIYQSTPQRELARQAPPVETKIPLQQWCQLDEEREGVLPIQVTHDGCNCNPPCQRGRAWTRQIETIEIAEGDAITDSAEAYNLMRQRGIENVIVMGVHTNMCVLGRPFSIRQLSYQGLNVALMRDMTDTMYDSRGAPYVSHYTGTDLIVQHIERYWGPTLTSVDFLGGEEFRFHKDTRPHVVIVMAEDEYRTARTLPEFAEQHLGRDFRVTLIYQGREDKHNLPGIDALEEADVVLLSIRRRAFPTEQLDVLRRFVAAGKPVVAIRTTSHGFELRGADAPEGHAMWPEFDNEILGCDYTGHHGNKSADSPRTYVQVNPTEGDHPILAGVRTDEFIVASWLYKSSPLAEEATLLISGRCGDREPHEPVAWTHQTSAGGRVFYTSLGHPADFEDPDFNRLLLNSLHWATEQDIPESPPEEGEGIRLDEYPSPFQSSSDMKVHDGLAVDLLLHEPLVAQPVFLNFDERGRMWVVQYRQYPNPAGLTLVSRDQYWRNVYDRVPPAPPHHFPGLDRITIHEDTDGDGTFDHHKVFIDGLNIVTAVERGRGGVWVLNPPYLLFYPDRDNDDVPDGDPEVHLAGFGLQDTHSVVNSLRWGPDGWLYAAQGSTVTANVTRPGFDDEPVHSMGQLIWRYQPESRTYEIFAEGGGNTFGVEIDSQGRIYSGTNEGNTRGYHYVQGGYSRKGFNKHGELSNPYVFGHIPFMRHHDVSRFTHNFIIYDHGAMPESFNGRLFGVQPMRTHVVQSSIEPDGSSFRTEDINHILDGDEWFRPVDIKVGPDGAIYLADWHDRQTNHYRNHEGQITPSSGRIWRLRSADAAPVAPFDLAQSSTEELIELLSHENRWWRQTAQRLLADRRDASAIPILRKMLLESAGQLALESLWALNVSGGLDDATALLACDHEDPFVRLWTVRLMCDDGQTNAELAQKMAALALLEPHAEVRSQLACSAKRLPAEQCLPIVAGLLIHEEDVSDIHLPKLIWWAIEAQCETPDAVLAMFSDESLWSEAIMDQYVLERLMRRFATAGSRRDLHACARLLDMAPADSRGRLINGFEEASRGRSLGSLPDELVAALGRVGGGSLDIQVRLGNADAIAQVLAQMADDDVDANKRVSYIELFGEIRVAEAVPTLIALVQQENNAELRRAAITTLTSYDEEDIPRTILSVYASLTDDQRDAAQTLLISRPGWALALLQAVDEGQLHRDLVPLDVIHRLLFHNDDRIAQLVEKHWGDLGGSTDEQMREELVRLLEIAESGGGNPYDGQKLFTQHCGKCHQLFGSGGDIGPDLTSYQRDDMQNILLSIVNPSAEIREGFENFVVFTDDGLTLNGFLADQDNQVVVLRGPDGQTTVIPRDEIDEMRAIARSVMPDGLLNELTDEQVRDLLAYLRSSQPLNN